MRKHYTSLNPAGTFTVSANSLGYVVLTMNAETTANITAGRYVYDVELVSPSNNVTRVFEGQVKVTPNVTR